MLAAANMNSDVLGFIATVVELIPNLLVFLQPGFQINFLSTTSKDTEASGLVLHWICVPEYNEIQNLQVCMQS